MIKRYNISLADLGINTPDEHGEWVKWEDIEEAKKSGELDDGYHTFKELYAHRIELFIALMKSHPKLSWRANNQADGKNFRGWFIAGMHLPSGDISYHLPSEKWEDLDYYGITTTNKAPKWDGHTSKDVVNRLRKWEQKNNA